jgi:hypothetical protein
VLPHLLHFHAKTAVEIKVRDALVEVASLWVISYRLRHRKGTSPDMTEADLGEIDRSLALFSAAYSSTIAKVKYADGKPNTQKFHKLAHATDVIRRLGQLRHLTSNHFEHGHVITKRAYGRTSRRHNTVHKEMVKHQRASGIALQWVTAQTQRSNSTAFLRAFDSSRHELQASGTRMAWRVWARRASAVTSADARVAAAAKRQLDVQPELKYMPAAMEQYIAEPVHRLSVSPPNDIKVVSAGCLAASVPWLAAPKDPQVALQPVRASSECWGGPWFSNVSVDGGGGGTWYAQLRLLFTAGDEKLAFVRWYEVVEGKSDALTKHNCVPLVWATWTGAGAVGAGRAQEWYQVIHVGSIIARQYIVPNFAEGKGHFHVSPFKWDRMPADKSGFLSEANMP